MISPSASAAKTRSKGLAKHLRSALRDLISNWQNGPLETTNKELELFAYSVSHELRGPLRHVVGFAELLQRQGSPWDAKSCRYLEMIFDSLKENGHPD